MANRGDGKQTETKGSGAGVSCLVIGAGVLIAGICIMGTVAAISIPSFLTYVKREKTVETSGNLRAMYAGAAAYYGAEHVTADGSVLHACSVGPAITPDVPGPHKASLSGRWPEAFVALGWTPPDPLYYRYEIVSGPSRCGIGPNEPIYSFRAYGDLDGDGVLSTFELPASSNDVNELHRAPSIVVIQELE